MKLNKHCMNCEAELARKCLYLYAHFLGGRFLPEGAN